MPSPSLVLLRTQSDARLVALAREGHERAFEAIVERYRRQLPRACRRLLPEARAEDALQQALVAAWRGLERGDDVRELRPWLHRIAHNTALNVLRQSGYDYDELQESLRIAGAGEDELERRAVVRQTLQGLAALPPRQREALLAIAVEGRSQDDVAGELGLSTGAVRQLVHRARSAMRAAATAVVPAPMVAWAAAAAPRGELPARIAELTAGAGGVGATAALAKAGTVVVLAGGAVAGPALVEKRADVRVPPVDAAVAATRPEAVRATVAPRRTAPATAPAAARLVGTRPSAPRRAPEHRRPTTVIAPRRTARRHEDDDPDRSDGGSGPSDGGRKEHSGDDGGSGSGPSGGGDGGRTDGGGSGGTTPSGDSSGPGSVTAVDFRDRSGSDRRSGSSGPGPSSGSGSGSGSGPGPGIVEEVATATPTPTPQIDNSGPGSGGSSGSGDLRDD